MFRLTKIESINQVIGEIGVGDSIKGKLLERVEPGNMIELSHDKGYRVSSEIVEVKEHPTFNKTLIVRTMNSVYHLTEIE